MGANSFQVLREVNAFDQWVSHSMADNADHEKFGSLLSCLPSQCGSNNDQCPKNIESVRDALNNHNWDDDWKEKKQKKKQRKKSQKDDDSQQSANSNDNEKDVTKMTETSFLQKSGGFGENQCFCCSNAGHHSSKCKCEDRPKNGWAVHKGTAQMHNGFGAIANNDNSQDDLINANNNNDNRNQNQN